MLLRLTKGQMLERWKRNHGIEPINSECTIEVTDGINLDGLIEGKMRSWYLELLDEGNPAYVAATDVAEAMNRQKVEVGRYRLPGEVRRLLSIRMSGWRRPARIMLEGTDEARRAEALALTGCVATPVAVLGADKSVSVYPAKEGDAVVEAMAVTDPGPELYVLDDGALEVMEFRF